MKILLTFMLVMAGLCSGFSQSDSLKKFSEPDKKFIPGFNYHLQVQHLDISPILAWNLTKRFQPGVGLNFLYYYRNSQYLHKTSYGVNLFARYYTTKSTFFHAEYLFANIPYRNELDYEYSRVYTADFFLGGGYRQPLSKKLYSYFTGLVNLTDKANSPFEDRILFKAGLTF